MKIEKTEGKLISAIKNKNRFIILKDGWIQDNLTGLDWGQSSEKKMNFNNAVKYCLDNGSRLPEIQELHSLVDFSKKQPATFPIFKDTKFDDWYWSGTPSLAWSNAAWCVSFCYGFVSGSHEGYDFYVRPVRASQ